MTRSSKPTADDYWITIVHEDVCENTKDMCKILVIPENYVGWSTGEHYSYLKKFKDKKTTIDVQGDRTTLRSRTGDFLTIQRIAFDKVS